jgi:phosphonate transport system substrate-binding protein
MEPLRFTSIQAGNADDDCAAVVGQVGALLGIPVEFAALEAWQERERAFDAGRVQVCWMCGAVYIRKLARGEGRVELLSAPVMSASRYGGRPIYFSDVVVAAGSRFRTFADLRGASWAYNEPNSHSGYTVTRWYLASRGHGSGYFGRVVGSGAHQRSLEMVLAGQVDASAIDSTVLETELARHPELAGQLRTVETFGPSPIPPWVMHQDLPERLKSDLRGAFAGLQASEAGRAVLTGARMTRFAAVTDSDYDPLRRMTETAEAVMLA